MIRLECFDIQADEALKRDSEVQVAVGSVDHHGDGDRIALVGADDIERFLDAASLGHHILDDQQAFFGMDPESSTQDKSPLLLLDENEAALQLSCDLLSDDQAAHGGRDDGLDVESGSFRCERGTETLHDRHLLQGLGALEELP